MFERFFRPLVLSQSERAKNDRRFAMIVLGFVLLVFAINAIINPVQALVPSTVCSAAGFAHDAGHSVRSGAYSSSTCPVSGMYACNVDTDVPAWSDGTYTIYNNIGVCGSCGASLCFTYNTQYVYVTPTPTPEPPDNSSVCVSRFGYQYRPSSLFGQQGNLIYILTGSSAAASPFWWMASITDPCPADVIPTGGNTTPVPTAVITYSPPPVMSYQPVHTVGTSAPILYPTYPSSSIGNRSSSVPIATIPSNLSIPLLPAALPTLPQEINSTSYISFINNTAIVGPLIVVPLGYVDTLEGWFNAQIMFFLSALVSPFAYLVSTFASVTSQFDGIVSGWNLYASLIVSVMWQSMMSVPPKVWNVIFVSLLIDIIEQILEWPGDV